MAQDPNSTGFEDTFFFDKTTYTIFTTYTTTIDANNN